ncbi:hypothetical protein FRAHR75_400009 [Frankia sp. Hr75.2]|nr:hypothetical protein FRAHR75_400009 [Frankia sp. Hr75.2]
MSGPPSYGQDATSVSRPVALRAAATVRRYVCDPVERLEVLAALGLTGPDMTAAPRGDTAGPLDRTRSGPIFPHHEPITGSNLDSGQLRVDG